MTLTVNKTIEKKKIRLDFKKAHIAYYNKEGKKVVGTTTALGLRDKPGLVGWAYKKGLEGESLYEKDQGANIGTITHAKILGYFKGYEIDNYNITPEAWELSENCLDSFKEWTRGQTFETILAEEPIVSEKYQYGGTFDWYGKHNGVLTVIDFKTKSPGIYETDLYQLAAYAQALKEHGHEVEKTLCVCIPKSADDSFMIQGYSVKDLKKHFQCFLRLKELWELERDIKHNKKGGK